jgi:hypothetical protein
MNTIVIERRLSEGEARGLTGSIVTSLVSMPSPRPAEWLPVPQWIEPASARAGKARKPVRARRGFWVQVKSQPDAEVICMGLLAAAAVVGIAYGFSCLVDLVQHWALFNVGVGHLIQ